MTLINLTPHAVVIDLKTSRREIPPSGTVARVVTLGHGSTGVDGIPLRVVCTSGIEGLPAPQPRTTYIVSAMVAQHPDVGDRDDLVAPDTDRAIRDAQGRIVAVPGFIQFI